MPGVVRVGQDVHVGHASPSPSPFHQTPYAVGSPNVFTNDSSTVRLGDVTACGDPAVGDTAPQTAFAPAYFKYCHRPE